MILSENQGQSSRIYVINMYVTNVTFEQVSAMPIVFIVSCAVLQEIHHDHSV